MRRRCSRGWRDEEGETATSTSEMSRRVPEAEEGENDVGGTDKLMSIASTAAEMGLHSVWAIRPDQGTMS